MNPLEKKIIRHIVKYGPIDISQYMLMALADPEYGYYRKANPFGREGDFITAPETSQMFGEIIAVWAISAWQNMGCPKSFLLCEMGPGRGTLMDDVLRTVGKIAPECLACACIALVETSQKLTEIQKNRLSIHPAGITWTENFSDLPDFPLVLVANELFDVLPVHQYVPDNGCLRERMISVDQNGKLFFCPGQYQNDCAGILGATERISGKAIIEISPARLALATQIGQFLIRNRGAALIIDYGSLEPGYGDTLQAVSRHSFCNPLENPGNCDLTSHVDFSALAQAAHDTGCHTAALTQGDFLLKLGLLERAGRLGFNKNEAFRQQVTTDVERLASPDQMGKLFKVLCIADPTTETPPFHWEKSPTPS